MINSYNLTTQDKRLIERYWKSGVIYRFRVFFPDFDKIIKKLETLGVVKRVEWGKYTIDRNRYNELIDKEDISKQTEL